MRLGYTPPDANPEFQDHGVINNNTNNTNTNNKNNNDNNNNK